MTIAVNRNLSNCEKARKKDFGASTGFTAMASEWIVLVLGLIFICQLFCYILVDGDVFSIQQEYSNSPRIRTWVLRTC